MFLSTQANGAEQEAPQRGAGTDRGSAGIVPKEQNGHCDSSWVGFRNLLGETASLVVKGVLFQADWYVYIYSCDMMIFLRCMHADWSRYKHIQRLCHYVIQRCMAYRTQSCDDMYMIYEVCYIRLATFCDCLGWSSDPFKWLLVTSK